MYANYIVPIFSFNFHNKHIGRLNINWFALAAMSILK